MGELIRQFDWSTTALGTPDQWPQSLRTTLGILLHSKFPMFLFWGEQLLCFYNDAYRPSLGNDGKHPGALGKLGEQVWPETWSIIKPLIDQVLSSGGATWSEDQLIPMYRNGHLEDVYWTLSYSPVVDESGTIPGVLVTCLETTRQVNTLNELAASKNEFDFAVEANALATWDFNPSTDTFRANARFNDWFGIEPDQATPFSQTIAAIAPQDQSRVTDLIEQTLRGASGGLYDTEYTLIHPHTGQTRRVRATGKAWFTAEQVAYRFSGTVQDITLQTTAQQKLKESELQSRSLVEQSPVRTLLLTGEQMIVTRANESVLKGWGKDASVIGKPLLDVLPQLREQVFPQLLAEVYATGQPYTAYEAPVRYVQENIDTIQYFDLTYQPMRMASGEIYGVLSTAVDVTAKVQTRQQIEASEARLRTAIEVAQLGTWSYDMATRQMTYSQQMLDWYGFEQEVVPISEVIGTFENGDLERHQRLLTGDAWWHNDTVIDDEHTIINRRTGQKYCIHSIGKRIVDEVGITIRIEGTSRDITIERNIQHALESQVQQRTEELAATNEELVATNEELLTTNEDFMAANRALEVANDDLVRSNQNLEQFAYIASHDLQEPLRKIQQFGDLLQNQHGDSLGEGIAYLHRMQIAAGRMSLLIKDLLTFSRISTSRAVTQPVSLNEVIHWAIDTLSVAIEETSAQLTIDPLPVVQGEEPQLHHLFQNLLSNALKFRRRTAAGDDVPPQITIRAAQVARHSLPDLLHPTRYAAFYHLIEVSDNGIGFEEKYRDRIFQVFQRLHGKNEFAGSGVGLAIVQKVVTNHGGAITATSTPGEGATFSVYLPEL